MATDRKATTQWQGDLKSGGGSVSLDTTRVAGPLQVSWPSRAAEPGGQTSPEELIAAAHSACYSMALSNLLDQQGHAPEALETSAVVTFDTDGGAHISGVALTVRGTVPGIDAGAFAEAAQAAKDGCPVSKALAGNVAITLDASLA
ncbi:MAG: OsmC family peroxiredoxin [Egibacteraceae bacterium]